MPVIAIVPDTWGAFIVREANGYRSREEGVLSSGSGVCADGQILGRRVRGAASALIAAAAGNVGNGTGAMDATPTGAGVVGGAYRAVFFSATGYTVFDPGGVAVGRGATGALFAGPVRFTITAGGTPFAAGDAFLITATFAAGTMEYAPYAAAGADGTEVAAAILFGHVDATAADVRVTVLDNDAEVQRANLVFAGTPTQDQKDAAYAALAARGIKFR